ncbi:MAG: hypothetical protein AAFO07_20690, partial [Bacteroidota bacterium]
INTFLVKCPGYSDFDIVVGLGILALFRIKSPLGVHRLLSILILVVVFINLGANFVNVILQKPNLFLLHIYTIIDFILLTLIFKSVLPTLIFRSMIVLFPLFAAINSIFFEKLMSLNELNRSISAFILMFYALSFFTKTLGEMKISRLESHPMFWISIGVLFYNASSFFIFLFSRKIDPYNDLWFTYFGLHSIFSIILYFFYTIALWVRPKTLPV